MAISFAKYPIANLSDICEAIKAAIESTGQYDSVTISHNASYTTATVTVKNNDVTYLTLSPGVTGYATFSATGGLTGAAYMSPQTYVHVGSSSKGVMIGFQKTGMLMSIVLVKSNNGKNLIFANVYATTQTATPSSFAMSEDASSNAAYPLTVSSSDLYSSAAGLCAQSVSNTVETADGAYFLAVRESVIPNPLTSSDATFRKITIGDKNYLTDGFFCLDE